MYIISDILWVIVLFTLNVMTKYIKYCILWVIVLFTLSVWTIYNSSCLIWLIMPVYIEYLQLVIPLCVHTCIVCVSALYIICCAFVDIYVMFLYRIKQFLNNWSDHIFLMYDKLYMHWASTMYRTSCNLWMVMACTMHNMLCMLWWPELCIINHVYIQSLLQHMITCKPSRLGIVHLKPTLWMLYISFCRMLHRHVCLYIKQTNNVIWFCHVSKWVTSKEASPSPLKHFSYWSDFPLLLLLSPVS